MRYCVLTRHEQGHRGNDHKVWHVSVPTLKPKGTHGERTDPNKTLGNSGTDLFAWNGNDYLLIVDYYSQFIEFVRLNDTKAISVITHIKAVFTRHGIPSVVRSDNGPQYSATEYKQFSKSWGFTHITTSPYHSQSNGLAEKSVQILKRILNKAKQGGTDPYLGLLEYRNAVVDNVGSPAQLSMSRQLRSVHQSTSYITTPWSKSDRAKCSDRVTQAKTNTEKRAIWQRSQNTTNFTTKRSSKNTNTGSLNSCSGCKRSKHPTLIHCSDAWWSKLLQK